MVGTRIDWVREHCRLLRSISAEFRQTRPFGGLIIGTGIHLEAKTVALLLTLRDGGARDGRRVHLLARGHMFNLAGPRPLGNSIESMDLGFALQARCLEAVANRSVDATSCVVPVPGQIDAAIASSYLDHRYPPRIR